MKVYCIVRAGGLTGSDEVLWAGSDPGIAREWIEYHKAHGTLGKERCSITSLEGAEHIARHVSIVDSMASATLNFSKTIADLTDQVTGLREAFKVLRRHVYLGKTGADYLGKTGADLFGEDEPIRGGPRITNRRGTMTHETASFPDVASRKKPRSKKGRKA